jgi:hypothetical protein
VLCTSSTISQTRSLTWCDHRISHIRINSERIFRASFIARNHLSRGITHRAASSSCGIIDRTVSSVARHRHCAALFNARYHHRAVFSIDRHRHRAALSIAQYHHRAVSSIVRHSPSHGIIIARYYHRAVSSIARHRHRRQNSRPGDLLRPKIRAVRPHSNVRQGTETTRPHAAQDRWVTFPTGPGVLCGPHDARANPGPAAG